MCQSRPSAHQTPPRCHLTRVSQLFQNRSASLALPVRAPGSFATQFSLLDVPMRSAAHARETRDPCACFGRCVCGVMLLDLMVLGRRLARCASPIRDALDSKPIGSGGWSDMLTSTCSRCVVPLHHLSLVMVLVVLGLPIWIRR